MNFKLPISFNQYDQIILTDQGLASNCVQNKIRNGCHKACMYILFPHWLDVPKVGNKIGNTSEIN